MPTTRATYIGIAIVAVLPCVGDLRTGHVLLARLAQRAATTGAAGPRGDKRSTAFAEPDRLGAIAYVTGALETLNAPVVRSTVAPERTATLGARLTGAATTAAEPT